MPHRLRGMFHEPPLCKRLLQFQCKLQQPLGHRLFLNCSQNGRYLCGNAN